MAGGVGAALVAGEDPQAFIQQRIPTSIDGSGPPRSRAAPRRAATSRSPESMVSMSSMRGSAKRKYYPVPRTGAHCESSYAGPHVRSLKWVLTMKDRQL